MPVRLPEDHIEITSMSKQPTEKKLAQLASAREVAIKNRQQKAMERAQERLTKLRRSLGDLDNSQLERVSYLIVDKEEQLRARQNELTIAMNNKRTSSINYD